MSFPPLSMACSSYLDGQDKMTYAKSLRVIGQSLEVARVTTFELERDGQDYLVRSDSLTQTGDWILRNAISESDFTEQSGRRSTVNRPLRFTPVDISRLDSHRQKQRRTHSSSQRKVQVSCLNF